MYGEEGYNAHMRYQMVVETPYPTDRIRVPDHMIIQIVINFTATLEHQYWDPRVQESEHPTTVLDVSKSSTKPCRTKPCRMRRSRRSRTSKSISSQLNAQHTHTHHHPRHPTTTHTADDSHTTSMRFNAVACAPHSFCCNERGRAGGACTRSTQS